MLQLLTDIAANRMPSVADLLKQASEAKPSVASKASSGGPKAGEARAAGPRNAAKPSTGSDKPSPKVPGIVDTESKQQPTEKNSESREPGKSACKPALRLPVTTLSGDGANKAGPPSSEAGRKMDEAVRRQEDLLAEFDKIVSELNNVLANLEGSTLVKRLKAASREQYRVGGRIGGQLDGAFGSPAPARNASLKRSFLDLSEAEVRSSHNASRIMDDMQAYFDRRRFVQFKNVLDEMKTQDVIGALRQLGDDLAGEPGLSIAQCEYWSDTMDRWAEDLVDTSRCGQCPGARSRGSLPPSIVLEALHILEGEVNLREDTRVVEQAKAALGREEVRRPGARAVEDARRAEAAHAQAERAHPCIARR